MRIVWQILAWCCIIQHNIANVFSFSFNFILTREINGDHNFISLYFHLNENNILCDCIDNWILAKNVYIYIYEYYKGVSILEKHAGVPALFSSDSAISGKHTRLRVRPYHAFVQHDVWFQTVLTHWGMMTYVDWVISGAIHWPFTRYAKLRVAHRPGMPGTFSPPPRINDPDMHHAKCAALVPWCMSGSLTSGFL